MSRETIKAVPLSAQEQQRLETCEPSERGPRHAKLGKWGTEEFVLPITLDVNFIRNDFQLYPDDLWIVTPPKCGTTWMQEIVWLLHTNADVSKAQYNQFYRIPFLELGPLVGKNFPGEKPDFDNTEKTEENVVRFIKYSMDYVQSLKRPRLIKSHMPLQLLPKKLLETCKVRSSFC